MTKLKATQDSFEYFVFEIFSKSFDNFIGGNHVKTTAQLLQHNKQTARVSARDHFKSTSLYAFIMWRIWCDWNINIESHYFSYGHQMSEYHIQKIKILIANNPFFAECIDLKPTADSIIKYTWDNKHAFKLNPRGLLGFKRGIHCDDLYVDDPFQDPDNKMLLTGIKKINNIVKSNIMEMPSRFFHIVGTPQTHDDFFFDKNVMTRFNVKFLPAIIDEKKKQVLWPEFRGWEELMKRKLEKGEKLFAQEYLCSPVYAEEAFFTRDQITQVIHNELTCVDINTKHKFEGDIIAGFDIGKKAHPSHFAAFQVLEERWKMIYHKFMDNWDYTAQLDWLRDAIANLGIDKLYYDDTRGEFEGFKEKNELPPQMEGVHFNVKTKQNMSAQFDKLVSNGTIELINDRRFIEQILLVTNDLQAVETAEGHGDSFWSVSLALNWLVQPVPNIRFL